MFVHLKQKKTVKLELNYKYLLLGIAILTLLLVSCRQSGWSLIGGVSKKQAEKNFSDFLTKNYPNELAFTNLKRFFNEGNMNPNMFSVEVYQINRPEITFVTFFDAKKIVGAKDIASDYLDGPSFDQLYKQEIAHMDALDLLRIQLKRHHVDLVIESYNTMNWSFIENVSEQELRTAIDNCIEVLNELKDKLNFYGDLKIQLIESNSKYEHLSFTITKENDFYELESIRCHQESLLYQRLQKLISKPPKSHGDYNEVFIPSEFSSVILINPSNYSELIGVQFYDDKKKDSITENTYSRAVGYGIFQMIYQGNIEFTATSYYTLSYSLSYLDVIEETNASFKSL